MYGSIVSGDMGHSVLKNASKSPFWVYPIFRNDDNANPDMQDRQYFVLVSQFQSPTHFVLTSLDQYLVNPNIAMPLVICSVFDDYIHNRNLTLVRAEVIPPSTISKEDMSIIIPQLLHSYSDENDYTNLVHTFNHRSNDFHWDKFLEWRKHQWYKIKTNDTTKES
jgi:ATP11 protein